MTGLEVFSKKFSYYVLMVIRDNPGISKIDLMRSYGGPLSHTLFMRTQELYEIGLIKYEHDDTNCKKRGQWNLINMYLTDKGQRVAAYLEKIAKEMAADDD